MRVVVSIVSVTIVISLTWTVAVGQGKKAQKHCRGENGCRSPFRIIIDGGSTGSRLHIFEFVTNSTTTNSTSLFDDDNVTCVRRGSSRADVPMSSFARNVDRSSTANSINTDDDFDDNTLVPATVAAHLVPLFDYAASVIPARYHATTSVRYEATAGMRLVEEIEQAAVYDALHEGLVKSVLPNHGDVFPFRDFKREDIRTLSGELEGFYGVVAANYLSGTIDAKLRMKRKKQKKNEKDESPYEEALGAMDMGGSSTQLVFLPAEEPPPTTDNHFDITRTDSPITVLRQDDFFSHSYLSYGVDQMREHLWNLWIQEHGLEENDENLTKNNTLHNPCAFRGLKIRWNGHLLVGTGDVDTCSDHIKRLIPSLENPSPPFKSDKELGHTVGGIRHPPIRGKFLAMSLYFFVFDFLRVMTSSSSTTIQEHWPSPSLQELATALPHLCQRSWEGDLELYELSPTHTYTRAAILPHRCFEAVYLVTLLRDGYGFDPDSRDVSFIFDVWGSEVEWTMGHALSSYAAEEAAKGSSDSRSESGDGKDCGNAIGSTVGEALSMETLLGQSEDSINLVVQNNRYIIPTESTSLSLDR